MADLFGISLEFGVSAVDKIVTAGYSFLKDQNKKHDFLGNATERYVRGMINRYGQMKIIGMREPRPLINLYVRATVIEKIRAQMGVSLKYLEESFELDKRKFGEAIETIEAEDIANKHDKFIVLGKPGAGKTTFLRYVALAMLHEQSTIKNRRLPVFVTLRDWADKGGTLMEYIVKEFEVCGFEEAELFVEHSLKKGNMLVLLDGLDEVSQENNLDEIISEIRDFTDTYFDNQFILSCRVAAYNGYFEQFTDVEMADFDEGQMEQFIKNWFLDEPKVGKECWQRIKDNSQYKELASTPLLLALLCITYEDRNDFPTNRGELYKKAIDALLERWDSSRRIRRDHPVSHLSPERQKDMFAQIAYHTFSENNYFFRQDYLQRMIQSYIKNIAAFNTGDLKQDSLAILKSIEKNSGIYAQRAQRIYSFAHLTFQEYFTALYIVQNIGKGEVKNLATQYLYDNKWREVYLLVASTLPDAEPLILEMFNHNRKLLQSSPQLNLFLTEISTLLVSNKSQHTRPDRLLVAILFALASALASARTLARAHALALASALASDRASDLASDLARASDLAFDLIRDLVRDRDLVLDLDLARDFDLKSDLLVEYGEKLNINIDAYNNLEQFLEGNNLILQCLQTECYLSQETRQKILDTMFDPLPE